MINGAKMWTSLADHADYIWLAARTDPKVKKHRGISVFLVPTSSPGFKITQIATLGGIRTNATFYENVRVPADNLIGGENNGWSLITGQLNHERVSLMNVGPVRRILDEARRWAQETKLADGRRVIDEPWVQANLARVHAKLEVLRLMNWKQAWALQHGQLHPADASAVKVFGSEFYVEAYRALLEIFGAQGLLRAGLARRRAAGPRRDDVPQHADPHLRRRHQRGAARHHRDDGARSAALQELRRETRWISRSPKNSRKSGISRARSSRIAAPRSA